MQQDILLIYYKNIHCNCDGFSLSVITFNHKQIGSAKHQGKLKWTYILPPLKNEVRLVFPKSNSSNFVQVIEKFTKIYNVKLISLNLLRNMSW